jgi:hypothetical protein
VKKFFQAYEKVCKKEEGRILGVEAARVDMGRFAWCAWAYIVMHVDRVHLGGLLAGIRAIQQECH